MAVQFKPCVVEGCNRNAHPSKDGRRGMCTSHYRRWVAHGDPLAGATGMKEASQFYQDVVVPCRSGGCLTWPYSRTDKGYGKMYRGERLMYVHRMACEAVHGLPPSPEHQVAHSCGKGHLGCVNPMHLSWKTKLENEADKIGHGTIARGEHCGSSKLVEDEVRQIRSLRGVHSQKAIGEMFGVCAATVNLIQNGKTWAHLL